MHQLVTLEGALGLELLAAHVTEVCLLRAVPVHVRFQVTFAARGVFTQ